MNYSYVAYTKDKRLVSGKLSASNGEAAATLLSYGGYQVISLKQITPFLNAEKLVAAFSQIRPKETVMFSRQLALLLESGTDIVASLELLRDQITNRAMKNMISDTASDVRGGGSLSGALAKHPRVFSRTYCQAMAAGEQGGNLEVVLRQMADHIERDATTQKKVKNALTYPFVIAIVATLVIILLITFVLPTFTSLYASFNVELPLITRIFIGVTEWFSHYGLYLIAVILVAVGSVFAYVKTTMGKYQWDKLLLMLPVLGRINLLSELARCCRTMSLLYRIGLALPETMSLAISASNNKVIAEALTRVRQELIGGEGLSKPMSKRGVFLPLMVQMVRVGEETGNLDNTLATVAQSFETEADDLTTSAVGLIQPVITIVIGLVVGFVALSLVEAMYSVYGQISF